MFKWSSLVFLVLTTYAGYGQTLTRDFAPGEKALMPKYLSNVITKESKRNNELTSPVRSMAEWEELQGLIISWDNNFRDIQAEIVRNTIPQCNIIIACKNEESVRNFLLSKGISDSINVKLIKADYNALWVRDYGPNTVYTNDVDSLVLVDWIYNRPRYQDDTLARIISRTIGLPLVETNNSPEDLVHTGGNYMSDGLGFAFSSLLVMDENGPNNEFGISNHTEAEVDSIMAKYMGTRVYPKMKNLPYDAIHHIDMHMKILDEQNILVGKYANDVADGAQINANVEYILDSYRNSFGKPFVIHHIPMPPGPNGKYPNQNGDYRTYTNSVFVNKTVLVPFYAQQYDTIAQRIYESLLPGYNIVGIDCNKIIPSLGAIHCITKEVGVSDPLFIAVDQIPEIIEMNDENLRKVKAIVKHKSGINKVMLFFRSDDINNSWDSLEMIKVSSDSSLYEIILPEFINWSEYFVTGISNSGKSISRPMTAPDGHYRTRTLKTNSNNVFNSHAKVEVYPNPATSITCVHLNYEIKEDLNIGLYSVKGECLLSMFDGKWSSSDKKFFFDASKLSKGVYFVRAQSANSLSVVPVVVH